MILLVVVVANQESVMVEFVVVAVNDVVALVPAVAAPAAVAA